MQKSCHQCSAPYEIDDTDEDFFARVGMPIPIDCPDCRRQRRLMFRNFFHLYHRTCDLSGKKIISMYDTGTPFPVYEMHEWWSDKWDPMTYGLEPDFSLSFFEQIAVLHRTVPRMSIMNAQCENTDYCNMAYGSRNCYLVFGNVHSEDCAYGHIIWHSKDCYDCLYCYRCELCYECVDCVQCHSIAFSRNCDNCSSSRFLIHCVGCHNCFGCVGLKNKQYHIFNEPYSKQEYETRMADLRPGDHRTLVSVRERIRQLVGQEIVKTYHGFNCENVTGDYLYNCRNIADGYDLKQCEDCRHCATLEGYTDSQDCNFSANSCELSYNSITSYGYHVLCCQSCMSPSSDITYCDNCFNCKDCFGCVGLKQKQYCILNRQYSKEEYETLVPKIINMMRNDGGGAMNRLSGATAVALSSGGASTGSWGQYFPHSVSPFAYNETIAFQYFPLSKAEVESRGWRWKNLEPSEQQYLGPVVTIPDSIDDISDVILKDILVCEATGKPYKIIPKELTFYRQMEIPLPRKCFEQRHKERMALRNPRKLWKRACGKCAKEIQTTYQPSRPEIVYCEQCYLSAIY